MKKKYKITELDCAHCAQKIEDEINKVEGLTANLSFIQQKLTVEMADDADVEAVTEQIIKIAHKVEPDCQISL